VDWNMVQIGQVHSLTRRALVTLGFLFGAGNRRGAPMCFTLSVAKWGVSFLDSRRGHLAKSRSPAEIGSGRFTHSLP